MGVLMSRLKLGDDGTLWQEGRRFDPWNWRWIDGPQPPGTVSVEPRAGLAAVMGARRVRRLPVGLIGPREPEGRQSEVARAVGHGLAELGVQLICGGKGGVMEAACRGHLEAGGLPIGLLPDEEWSGANPYVAIPIAT